MSSRQDVLNNNTNSFPNNNSGQITPAVLRDFNADFINSVVFIGDQVSSSISASYSNNATTASFATNAANAANATSSSFASNAANAANAANATSASYALTASFALNAPTVDTGSFVTTSSFNTFSSSISGRVASLEQFSSSLDATFATDAQLNAVTASLNALSSSYIATSASFTSTSSSLSSAVNSLTAATASYVNSSITGSSLVTASVNINVLTFTKGNGSTFNLTVQSSGSVATASYADFAVSASYAATTSFAGQFNVATSLTASGLRYPTTDGIYASQVLQTNAAGTLSFGNVEAIYEDIQNGEATTLTKGTAVYISGSQGDRPIVYRADASISSKMPVAFIVAENINAGANGRGITLGLIRGFNTALPVGTELFVDGNGTLTNTRPTGSSDIVQLIGVVVKTGSGGILNVLNPGPTNLPNLQSGYVWVGNANSFPTAVATSSIQNVVSSSYSNFAASIPSGLNISASNITVSNNLVVNGTASFGYLQTVSGSAVIIGEQYIVLNADTPTAPFAGIQVYDTGSASTASFEWNGNTDNWIVVEETGLSAGILTGPSGSKGSEVFPTVNRILKGTGHHTVFDSNITDNGSIVSINSNTQITGSLVVSAGITGNLTGTASFATFATNAGNATTATSASYASNAGAAQTATSASFATNAANATTASYVLNAVSSSFATTAVSASFATNAANAANATSASFATNAANATTASYVLNAVSASFASNAANATSASFATNSVSSSFASNSTSASYALTASFALNAGGGINTGSFATTGSNTFVGNQIISGSLEMDGVIIADPVLGINTDYIQNSTSDLLILATIPNKVILSGGVVEVNTSTTITGSLDVTNNVVAQSFTGSLQGTASFATTASYALNAGAGGVQASDIYSYTFLLMGA